MTSWASTRPITMRTWHIYCTHTIWIINYSSTIPCTRCTPFRPITIYTFYSVIHRTSVTIRRLNKYRHYRIKCIWCGRCIWCGLRIRRRSCLRLFCFFIIFTTIIQQNNKSKKNSNKSKPCFIIIILIHSSILLKMLTLSFTHQII